MSNQDEIIRAMEYNIAEKQRIIDKLIQENVESKLFQANMEILEGLLKILEILTEKKHS